MQIAIRQNLEVYDPADASLCEAGAHVLPMREAEAVMGETVAAFLARVAWRFDLPTVCRINGEFYARAEWETRALGLNDDVEFVSRPLGSSSGGSTGKSILSVVALVALTAVAGPLGGMAAGAAGFTAGTFAFNVVSSLTQAAIIGAGALAVSHFLKPKSGGKTNSTDALYSFGLQGNAARPMQPIPVLNGRLRFAPDYAAPTYSEYAGDAMTDYALYALTCGRMRVEQVLIGDTPIWNYQSGYSPDYPGIELQIVEPGEQVTLYPVNVVTADELSGAELSQDWTPGYIINAAGTQAKELLFDLVWPGGAYVTFKDRTLAATTHVQIRVRKVDDAGAPITGWTTIVDDQYQQAKQSQIRMTVRRLVESGRYEVQGRRANPSINDSGIAKIGGTDDVTWTAARAHIEGPQSFPRVTTLAVKGVASKQLTGVSGGQLRVIGTRILPVWRDGLFVEEPTRSIAWAALDWWRNSDYAAGLSITDVDFQSFVRHAALWDTLGHTFDHRFTEVQNLDDVLETVLKAGRAFPAPVGDKLTITRDEPRVLPRMLFTDNDIVRDTLEIDYALSDEAWADGMVGEYVDETTWRLAEVSSAPDGVTLLKPARVRLEGVVNRKQAAGMVRMMAAESQYRRITVSWTARMEGRLLKRGDLVRITTEEPETWGQSWASIEALAVRAFPDGATPIDALLIDLSNGTGDLRKGAATMVAGSMVDLGSAPMGKVVITGGAGVSIASFGPGRHLERLMRFVDGGATLVHNATSLSLPGAGNILTRAGDCLHATSDGSGNWTVRSYDRADGTAVSGVPTHTLGQCRLICTSSAQIRLTPWDGNQLLVGGIYVSIPAAGVNLSNAGLVAGTLYYVYAYVTSGALTLEASTVPPNIDPVTSTIIKSNDGSRTLVGMVYMDAGSPGTFADTGLKRFTASYFNRRTRTIEGPYFVASTTSTSEVELNPAARVNFITWGDEATSLRIAGFSENFSAGQANNLRLSFNGSAVGSMSSVTSASAFARGAVSASADLPDARGYNVATILASVSGGTGNFSLSIMGTTRI